MNSFKIENSAVLNDDKFSAMDYDTLWNKLSDYVYGNASNFSNINANKNEGKISVAVSDESKLKDFIKFTAPVPELKQKLIRTLQLNLKFDETLKSLVPTDENTENFSSYNTVSYQAACETADTESKNSLFFHDSALVNYDSDFNKDAYLACNDYLAVVTFNMTKNQVVDDDVVSTTTSDMIFVCYDRNERKLKHMNFNALNESATIDADQFIDAFNSGTIGSLSTLECAYSNFKIGVSMFKLLNDDENDIINFMKFNPMMYNKFIENLKKNMVDID